MLRVHACSSCRLMRSRHWLALALARLRRVELPSCRCTGVRVHGSTVGLATGVVYWPHEGRNGTRNQSRGAVSSFVSARSLRSFRRPSHVLCSSFQTDGLRASVVRLDEGRPGTAAADSAAENVAVCRAENEPRPYRTRRTRHRHRRRSIPAGSQPHSIAFRPCTREGAALSREPEKQITITF